jgi:hypothetical protein
MDEQGQPAARPRLDLRSCDVFTMKLRLMPSMLITSRIVPGFGLSATAIFVLPVEAGLERIYVRFAPDGRVHCVHFRPGDQTISPRPAGW